MRSATVPFYARDRDEIGARCRPAIVGRAGEDRRADADRIWRGALDESPRSAATSRNRPVGPPRSADRSIFYRSVTDMFLKWYGYGLIRKLRSSAEGGGETRWRARACMRAVTVRSPAT